MVLLQMRNASVWYLRQCVYKSIQALLLCFLQFPNLLFILVALFFDHFHGQLRIVQLLLQWTNIDVAHIQVGQIEIDPKYVAGSALIPALRTGLWSAKDIWFYCRESEIFLCVVYRSSHWFRQLWWNIWPQTVAKTSSAWPNNSAHITQFKFNIFGTNNYIKIVITKEQQINARRTVCAPNETQLTDGDFTMLQWAEFTTPVFVKNRL